MITLQPKKLNIITGAISSGKTPLAINIITEYLKKGQNVLYVTTDVDQHNIKRSIHCLYNDINFVEIKYAKDERTPVNLVLPPNITVIDSVKTMAELKESFDGVSKLGPIDLLVVDTVNFIKDEDEKEYKDRIDWINMLLNDFAKQNSVAVLGVLNLLKVIDNEPADFMLKDMGNFIFIDRKDAKEFEITENNDDSSKRTLTLSFKNLKMSTYDKTAIHQVDEDAYFGI